MSHELRTPLNSILILGQQLSENADGNLSARQIEFAKTIHSAGTDLLNLISDILDLSKIESGTVTVDIVEIYLTNLLQSVARPFQHEADSRQLKFELELDPSIGKSIFSDAKRLQQILKNLLSNAFKFTREGGIKFRIFCSSAGWTPDHPTLSKAASVIALEVSDTGIGIAPEKQKIIFEAFQQADASTSRKYGGTGLGLAISRELAALLGGEIQLKSSPGRGSTFTLYLPQHFSSPAAPALERTQVRPELAQISAEKHEVIQDDRGTIQEGDLTLLIVEDDPHYARVMADLARDQDFKVLVASRGDEALSLAMAYKPTAISLDVFLPDMLGWSILSQLKQNPETRHIPVQMLTLEEDRQRGLAHGAFSFLTKPVENSELKAAFDRIKTFTQPRRKTLVIIEDNEAECLGISALLAHDSVDIVSFMSGKDALAHLSVHPCDCIVLDLKLPDMTGFEILERMRHDEAMSAIPVIVFTGRELSAEEDAQLHAMARSVVVKGVELPERLLDETALFLHSVIAELPAEKRQMLDRLHSSDEDLVNKIVLLVDDDSRNIFALSSVLERRGMRVLTATTGREAVNLLSQNSEVAIVLMDIMMPEMDGYRTMQAIREKAEWRKLPIVALTAKAMKGDREKCLEAGASDYLAKPVNTEQLLAALRMWLHR